MDPEVPLADEFDTLTWYHHTTYDFDQKLLALFSILTLPKEYKLTERFKKIEAILDHQFRLELLYRLQLLKPASSTANPTLETHPPHPQLLLHFWCLLGCTDSISYLADYLELTAEEIQELIRELHHTFSIDSLTSRIRHYYEQNKQLKAIPEFLQQSERLGTEPTWEPKDIQEDRKRRLRKKYGNLADFFERMHHNF